MSVGTGIQPAKIRVTLKKAHHVGQAKSTARRKCPQDLRYHSKVWCRINGKPISGQVLIVLETLETEQIRSPTNVEGDMLTLGSHRRLDRRSSQCGRRHYFHV